MCAQSGADPCGGKPIDSFSGPAVAPVVEGSPLPATSTPNMVGPSSDLANSAGAGTTSLSKKSAPPGSLPLPSSFNPVLGSDLVFSPTKTEKWLRCPMFERYDKTWVPLAKASGAWTPHLALGNAIHAGLARHYTWTEGQDQPLNAAWDVLEEQFEEGASWTLDGLKKLVAKGIKAALDPSLLGPDDTVVATEDVVGECRVDLVIRTPAGLNIWDFKTKLELKSEWVMKDLAPFEESWQLQHNAWAISEKYGEPVVKAGVQLIVLSPKCKAYPATMDLSPERIASWLRSAEIVWGHMAENKPYMNTWSCRKFGRCDFWHACHVLGGDEAKFPAFYERRG